MILSAFSCASLPLSALVTFLRINPAAIPTAIPTIPIRPIMMGSMSLSPLSLTLDGMELFTKPSAVHTFTSLSPFTWLRLLPPLKPFPELPLKSVARGVVITDSPRHVLLLHIPPEVMGVLIPLPPPKSGSPFVMTVFQIIRHREDLATLHIAESGLYALVAGVALGRGGDIDSGLGKGDAPLRHPDGLQSM